MGELFKLRPDRDLQCYFRRPTAIAALSECSADGLTLSGSWREQFDWAVLEWNRDNVFEHPMLRNLPDGDFRGMTLEYRDTRTECQAIDSDLYAAVDWPYLRIWAGEPEDLYKVALKQYAAPVVGSYVPAGATFELLSLPVAGEYVGLSFLTEHHTYQVLGADTAESVALQITASINAFSAYMRAEIAGTRITVRYTGFNPETGHAHLMADSKTGANGNRVSAYAYCSTGVEGVWDQEFARLSGGASPTGWRIVLPFDGLVDTQGRAVPVQQIRKMRWTFAAAQQWGEFERTEWSVRLSDWVVSGARREYSVAGAGSVRVEDDAPEVLFTGSWTQGRGNFSGASIRYTTQPGAMVTVPYECLFEHELYMGSRYADGASRCEVRVDGGAWRAIDLRIGAEDVLARIPLGAYGPGPHVLDVRHAGSTGETIYFDFLEAAVKTSDLPVCPVKPRLTLATDWDTDHSIALAPERTAWIMRQLGFTGRANHYVGALWFYELHNPDGRHARTTFTLSGAVPVNGVVTLQLGTEQEGLTTTLEKLVHAGSTLESIARSFANELNRGASALGASVEGNQLTVWVRELGAGGNRFCAAMSCNVASMGIAGDGVFRGGADGKWWTDTSATPRINRACRDWTRSFYEALHADGVDVVSAFSTELQHGDWRPEAGLVQRYWLGAPVALNTPAVQTNFSPVAQAYWREVYREGAQLHVEAGLQPYLQFGEVQWWYFPYNPVGAEEGMPFYDSYTKATFLARYGREFRFIRTNAEDPVVFAEEVEHCSRLIGEYCEAVMAHVRATYPNTRFEVLYPLDVNEWPINRAVNYAPLVWRPDVLDCLKTEGFGLTTAGDLDKIREALGEARRRGFAPEQRAHLTGVQDTVIPWRQEVEMSEGEGMGNHVLWALDQYCLVGMSPYAEAPVPRSFVVGRAA